MPVRYCCLPHSRCPEHSDIKPSSHAVIASKVKFVDEVKFVITTPPLLSSDDNSASDDHSSNNSSNNSADTRVGSVCCPECRADPTACYTASNLVVAADYDCDSLFIEGREYQICDNAWSIFKKHLDMIEYDEDGARGYFRRKRGALSRHEALERLGPEILFGLLGRYPVLYVEDLPVSLEHFRALAICEQNERRRALLGPVVQLAAMWGLGRDVCWLILDAAVPRLRR